MVISDSGEHRLLACCVRQLAERFERSRASALQMFAASCRELQVRHGESVLRRTGSLCSPI
jgi:hypothetical protein